MGYENHACMRTFRINTTSSVPPSNRASMLSSNTLPPNDRSLRDIEKPFLLIPVAIPYIRIHMKINGNDAY